MTRQFEGRANVWRKPQHRSEASDLHPDQVQASPVGEDTVQSHTGAPTLDNHYCYHTLGV